MLYKNTREWQQLRALYVTDRPADSGRNSPNALGTTSAGQLQCWKLPRVTAAILSYSESRSKIDRNGAFSEWRVSHVFFEAEV